MLSGIDKLHVTTPERDDKPGNGFRILGSNQEVNMVCHEYIGVKSASLLVQRFVQPVQVNEIVFFAKEAGFAIVSPLHDV